MAKSHFKVSSPVNSEQFRYTITECVKAHLKGRAEFELTFEVFPKFMFQRLPLNGFRRMDDHTFNRLHEAVRASAHNFFSQYVEKR